MIGRHLRAFAGFMLPIGLLLGGCASLPLKQGGTLTSYDHLGDSKGNIAKSRVFVDGRGLASVKTIRIVPAVFAPAAASKVARESDRLLVSNALDRALCFALSDKYEMVFTNQPADLTVRSTVTDVIPTNKALAGLATAVTLGSSAVLPVSAPRLPVGLGALGVEAEAIDIGGAQLAAIVWARGANSIQNSPLVSEVGDAYGLASSFAGDFSRLLIERKPPGGIDLSLPSGAWVRSWLGGNPKYAACDSFGRAPGLVGVVAGKFGAPPEWTDHSAKVPG